LPNNNYQNQDQILLLDKDLNAAFILKKLNLKIENDVLTSPFYEVLMINDDNLDYWVYKWLVVFPYPKFPVNGYPYNLIRV
jgi:hypothetical protein